MGTLVVVVGTGPRYAHMSSWGKSGGGVAGSSKKQQLRANFKRSKNPNGHILNSKIGNRYDIDH